ncbi:hypothetical protein [Paenibacillus sp. FSL H8-0537]|uniref:hypothetical protein n=1 Tax=Paenibacillus sp. FSL H8-0537 TaxID=2921399 RepID=UPI00310173C7
MSANHTLMTQLQQFASVFGRHDIDLGEVYFHDEPLPVQEPLPLGEALRTFYSYLELQEHPMIGGVLAVQFFRLPELERAQQGWRWIMTASGLAPDPKWPDGWIVFADYNGDALIVDTTDPQGPVYGSIQKRHSQIAASLADFFAMTTALMKVEEEEFELDATEEDSEVKSEFIERAMELAPVMIGRKHGQQYLDFFFS